jgi:hypothetical protein
MVEQRDSEKLNEFQQEVNTAIELFWQAAQAKHGRVLGEHEVRLVAAYISGLTEGVMQLENQVGLLSNMLAAYKNEYGEDLFNTLTSEPQVVEGEIIKDGETDTTTIDGQVGETRRLDSSSQEEE